MNSRYIIVKKGDPDEISDQFNCQNSAQPKILFLNGL